MARDRRGLPDELAGLLVPIGVGGLVREADPSDASALHPCHGPLPLTALAGREGETEEATTEA